MPESIQFVNKWNIFHEKLTKFMEILWKQTLNDCLFLKTSFQSNTYFYFVLKDLFSFPFSLSVSSRFFTIF